MQKIKMVAQKMCPWQAIKVLHFFAFSANRRDRRKQNFARRDFEHLPLGFYNTKGAKIGLKMTGMPRHKKSGYVTTQLYRKSGLISDILLEGPAPPFFHVDCNVCGFTSYWKESAKLYLTE